MLIPQKWLNNNTSRMWLSAFNLRPYVYDKSVPFFPFFKYEIGDFKYDHTLYFQSEPSRGIYYVEIFNKMNEYTGYDLIAFIHFHYGYCEDKIGFVQFLRYMTDERLDWYRGASPRRYRERRKRLEMVRKWAEEEFQRLRDLERCLLLRKQYEASMPATIQQEMEGKMEAMLDLFAEEFGAMIRTHAGKITVHNEHHLTRVILLLMVLQNVKSLRGKGEMLFKSFTDVDMVTILQQFEAWGDKRPNTLQKKDRRGPAGL